MAKLFQKNSKAVFALLGNVLAATCLTAAAQNVPPAVSVTSPEPNTTFTVPATVTFAADANDSDGDITKVEFYEGSNLLGTATSAPYSSSWSNVPAGSYQLTAVATDNAEAVTTSSTVPITVITNTAPAISLINPVGNQSYASPATIMIAAHATDTDGTVAKVEFFEGTTLLVTLTEAPYSYLWEQVQQGSYTLSATVTDNDGAQTSAAPVAVNIISNAAPIVSMTATPSSAAAPATIMLEAMASDTDGAIAQVDFYNGSQLLGSVTQAPYAFTWSNVAGGSYNLTARAVDNAGMNTTSAAVIVTIGAGTAQVYFIETDHLNTPRVVTNSSNQVVWQWDNTDPFGANLPNEDPNNTGNSFTLNLRFPGQYYDRETGLHYNYYRDYDPQTGRYVQSDPIGLYGGINTYAYVENAPLSYTDPLGLWSVTVEGYLGPGGGITVSSSGGTWEVTGRLGVGYGGGIGYDPRGTPSAHAKECGEGFIGRASGKVAAGVALGPLGVGGAATLAAGNLITDKVGGGYTDVSITDLSMDRNKGVGVRLGASVGVDFGGYFNY